MLSVTQIRTVQWEREVSELSDLNMMSLATTMMKSPRFWTELENGEWRSNNIVHAGRSYLVVYSCLSAQDDIVLEIMQVQ